MFEQCAYPFGFALPDLRQKFFQAVHLRKGVKAGFQKLRKRVQASGGGRGRRIILSKMRSPRTRHRLSSFGPRWNSMSN